MPQSQTDGAENRDPLKIQAEERESSPDLQSSKHGSNVNTKRPHGDRSDLTLILSGFTF